MPTMSNPAMTPRPSIPANQLISPPTRGSKAKNNQFSTNPSATIIPKLIKKIPVLNSFSSARFNKFVCISVLWIYKI